MSDISQNGEAKGAPDGRGNTYHLSHVPTSVTLSAEQFERLYLTPMMRQQPALAKSVGNPTPL
jgi:hypothetical protein